MNGVVAYITETENGKTTLTFEDVSSDKGSPTCWRHEVLYMSRVITSQGSKYK